MWKYFDILFELLDQLQRGVLYVNTRGMGRVTTNLLISCSITRHLKKKNDLRIIILT